MCQLSLSVIVFLAIAVLGACQYPQSTLECKYDLDDCKQLGEDVGNDAGSEACQEVLYQCTSPSYYSNVIMAAAVAGSSTISPCQINYVAKCKTECIMYWLECRIQNPALDGVDAQNNCGDVMDLYETICETECAIAFNNAIL